VTGARTAPQDTHHPGADLRHALSQVPAPARPQQPGIKGNRSNNPRLRHRHANGRKPPEPLDELFLRWLTLDLSLAFRGPGKETNHRDAQRVLKWRGIRNRKHGFHERCSRAGLDLKQ
jgi:hypothetical protein